MRVMGLLALVGLIGCGSGEIPPAHRGLLLDKTGVLALWVGGAGFKGPVLGPGTYFLGIYPELVAVDCSQVTAKESLTALTKDGVQFGLDVYVSYGANCDEDASVRGILSKLVATSSTGAVDPKAAEKKPVEYGCMRVTSKQIYSTYIHPTLGEAVRETISAYIANDINEKRETIFEQIKVKFGNLVGAHKPELAKVYQLNLSNLDFPDQMDDANTQRAVQSILKDKSIAEREKVEAEIETAKMKKELAVNEATNEAVRIQAVGKALRENPEFLQFDMQQKMPEIYAKAGDKGGLVIAAPSPQILINRSK